MNRTGWLWVVMALLVGAGCTPNDSQEYGQCEAPDAHLKVMYKPKHPAIPFSHPFCVVCNTAIETDEFGEWAEAMGATSIPVEPDLPCLYVYTGQEKNVESLSECQSLVCDGTATYSDMVGSGNSNFDLTPVLDGSVFDALGAWSPLEHEPPEWSDRAFESRPVRDSMNPR